MLGRFGVPGYTAYCVEARRDRLHSALALELVNRKITVNAICPLVETGMAGRHDQGAATKTTYEEFRDSALGAVPIKRIIQPEEVAALIQFLAAQEPAPSPARPQHLRRTNHGLGVFGCIVRIVYGATSAPLIGQVGLHRPPSFA